MNIHKIEEQPSSITTHVLGALPIEALESRLKGLFGHYKQQMGPLLYWLREKLKAQGKKDQGFGAWVEANLDISRDTADRWADEYAIDEGLKPKPLGKMPKGEPGQSNEIRDESRRDTDPGAPHPVSFRLLMNDQQWELFRQAWDKLRATVGEDGAVQVVVNAVVTATEDPTPALRALKKPVHSATAKNRKRELLN
jgi:hypothetical protein